MTHDIRNQFAAGGKYRQYRLRFLQGYNNTHRTLRTLLRAAPEDESTTACLLLRLDTKLYAD
jgi:hypothetical protein